MSKQSKALLIDITKCIGCQQCAAACKAGHKQPGDPEPTLSATAFTAVERSSAITPRHSFAPLSGFLH